MVRDRLASCTYFQPKYQVPAKLGKDRSSEEDHFSPERRLTKSWASIWTWCLAERGPITPLRQATPCLFCFPLPYGLTLLISAACAASPMFPRSRSTSPPVTPPPSAAASSSPFVSVAALTSYAARLRMSTASGLGIASSAQAASSRSFEVADGELTALELGSGDLFVFPGGGLAQTCWG